MKDVFHIFKDYSKELRYSFDIVDRKTRLKLLKLIVETSLLNQIEITDRRLIVLSSLRKQYKLARFVYTLAENVNRISNKTINLEKLRKLNIQVINLRCKRNVGDLFRDVIDNGLNCYIWGVNTKTNMKRIVKMKYKDKVVDAIYTDYPDKLGNFIMEHFK
jgi:glycerophosphoryl diester phosphodiesterase